MHWIVRLCDPVHHFYVYLKNSQKMKNSVVCLNHQNQCLDQKCITHYVQKMHPDCVVYLSDATVSKAIRSFKYTYLLSHRYFLLQWMEGAEKRDKAGQL